MYFLRKKIFRLVGDPPISTELTPQEVTDELAAGANFPYKFSETVENGWDDVTSIENIDKYYLHTSKDFTFASSQIKLIFDAKTGADESAKWANCSDAEKDILAQRFLVSDPKVNERLTAQARMMYFGNMLKEAKAGRENRINTAMAVIGQMLVNTADRIDLFDSVSLSMNSYIVTGSTDLSDFMNSSGVYDNTTGFASKAYFSQSIVDTFNSIVNA